MLKNLISPRFILAITCILSLTHAGYTQTEASQKERKEKTPRVKRVKSPAPTTSSAKFDAQYNDDLKRFLANFRNAYANARDIANDYRLTRVLMEDQVKDLASVIPVNELRINQIKAKIKSLKKQEKVAQSNLKKYKQYAALLADINELSLSKQKKLISSIEEGYQKMPRVFPPPKVIPLTAEERPKAVVAKPNKAKATKRNTGTRPTPIAASTAGYAQYDRSKDVLYNPPVKECAYRFKGMDEFLGKEKIELEPQDFFFHTNPELRQYMNGKEYITCRAGLATSTGGLTTLNIEVVIRSHNAQREFGGLQKGNPLTIKLINGAIVKLLSINSDSGSYDQTTGLTTFRNQFLVQKGEEKSFLESEIDRIRLVWTNGYEDYDVYEVDFLMNQLNCLYSN